MAETGWPLIPREVLPAPVPPAVRGRRTPRAAQAEAGRQLSIFGAETTEPSPLDLAGLVAGPGRLDRMGGTARVAVTVDAAWRVHVLVAELVSRGLVVHWRPLQTGNEVRRLPSPPEPGAHPPTGSDGVHPTPPPGPATPPRHPDRPDDADEAPDPASWRDAGAPSRRPYSPDDVDGLDPDFALDDVGVIGAGVPTEPATTTGSGPAPGSREPDETAAGPKADAAPEADAGPEADADPDGAPAGTGDDDPPARPGPPQVAFEVRTAYSSRLNGLARTWPAAADQLFLSGPRLRLWVAAAGRPVDGGYALGLGDHDPATWPSVDAALRRAGLDGVLSDHGLDFLIMGRKRLARLAELVGDRPEAAPAELWPGGPAA